MTWCQRLCAAAAAAAMLLPLPVQARNPDGVELPRPADAFYCGERRLGTWFYCEPPERAALEAAAPPAMPAAIRLKAITAELEELKARAILEPSEANVAAYIRFQREQLDRASGFADMWRRAVWQDPALDYTLKRPVNTLAKRAWLDQRRGDRERVLARISQRYGVFYFYASSCAACQVFSPIMRGVADRFGLNVLAVSMDGGGSPSFPDFKIDTGQYERMGLAGGQVPALVLYDTQTKRPIPIGYGVMAADEVMERIFTLTHVKPGSDF